MGTKKFTRRFTDKGLHVDWQDIPEWIKYVISGALATIGTIVTGIFVANSQNRRTSVDDRSEFTQQMMERLNHVELQLAAALQSLAKERQYCDERMDHILAEAEAKLRDRDLTIIKLREEIANKQVSINNAVKRIEHLESLVDNDDGK